MSIDSRKLQLRFGFIVVVALLVVLCLTWFWPASEEKLANVHLIDRDEYLFNATEYLLDAEGNTILDTVLLPVATDIKGGSTDITSAGYLGAESCAECHRDYYDSFINTSHYKTSAVPTAANILGSFQPGENVLDTKSPNLTFEMIAQDGKFFQRVLVDAAGERFGAEFPFDFVTGSGKVGQTYLYWKDDFLYQLHVSYLTAAGGWINSPGYFDGTADFARPTLSYCLECHTTYFQAAKEALNEFRRDNYVLGISCEKCHGPGHSHVEFHRANPDVEEAHGIVNPSGLPVERARELCQLCHGGMPARMVEPPFSFRPGESLGNYYEFSELGQPTGVHSNTQMPRLSRSKCFQQSEAMTCTDCHNPHEFERGNLQLFSDRCMNCHEPQQCGQFEVVGASLSENCIDCHMPTRQMEDIQLMSKQGRLSPPMRDHWIKIWDEPGEQAEPLQR